MAEVRLSAGEAEALRAVLAALVVRKRTGELGMMHGAARFVGTHRVFGKPQREALDSAARKLGLGGIGEYAG